MPVPPKKRLVVGLIALAATAAGALTEERSAEPPELTQARSAYEAQVRLATEPHRQRYLRQLEDLKTQLTARGNLPAAMAVLDEIDKIRAGSGIPLAFDWQKLRHATSYSYAEPEAFAQSVVYADERRAKLLDGFIGDTYSPQSVGWQKAKPSPSGFQFTRPLLPSAIRRYLPGSSVRGFVFCCRR